MLSRLAHVLVSAIDTRYILFFCLRKILSTGFEVVGPLSICMYIVVHCSAAYSFHPIHIFPDLFGVEPMLLLHKYVSETE